MSSFVKLQKRNGSIRAFEQVVEKFGDDATTTLDSFQSRLRVILTTWFN